MALKDLVSVTVVTYNSGRFIKRCLESVLEQKYPNLEVVVIDNASTDGTVDILEQFADRCRIYYNDENIGFAAAQNQAIALSRGDWVLTLNPDVLLLQNFIQALVDAGQVDPKAGTVCGKLLTIRADLRSSGKAIGGFDRDLFHADAAAPGSRQPGSGQRPLSELRIRVRRHGGGGVVPAADDRRHFDRRTSSSIRISLSTAKTPMWPGGRS